MLLLATSCGSDSGGSGDAVVGGQPAVEAAYAEAHANAWIRSCKTALADIHRRDASRRAAKVRCARPKGQYEGNTAYDLDLARSQGREEGTFDGCAYAWDEAYAATGVDVEPRC